ncbi:hypothetical protein HPULCUR_010929 [Helicostylum pulchrum]|uniref:Peroxisome assembly protein 22 n=1 Tax=Helicostylum pulchrum TaxID=562976 RepID=A0ABP9YEM5_9FUNG
MATTTKYRLLPTWVMKLIGFSSLASALIGFAIYWFKKHPSRRNITREPTNETVLWNPSPDVDRPMYGFQEKSIQILTRLSYIYEVYIIVQVNSTEEKENIQELLENAASVDGLFFDSIDKRKVLYCSEEEGKMHIIRHIEPFIHVEGGWEKDDGQDIVNKLKPFISKIIWIMTKKKLDSILPTKNIELSDLLIDTSIAQQVKD